MKWRICRDSCLCCGPWIRNTKHETILRRSDLNYKCTWTMTDSCGTLQNLLPLILLRPLRLCIPAEQLRSARIVLLKLTHSPWVAAIWLYESVKLRVIGAQRDQYWDMPSNQQHSPAQPLGAARCLRHSPGSRGFSTLLVNKSEVSLPKIPMNSTHAFSTQASEVAELKQMIRKLSAQVEDLASRVESGQR